MSLISGWADADVEAGAVIRRRTTEQLVNDGSLLEINI